MRKRRGELKGSGGRKGKQNKEGEEGGVEKGKEK